MADLQLTGKPTAGINPVFLQGVMSAARAAGATKLNITSGYRSPAYNRQVGGAGDSNHTRGLAMDATAYIPGQGWVPVGNLSTLGQYGIRSGNQPGFFNGKPDPVHVDAGYEATGYTPPASAGITTLPYTGQPSGVQTLPYTGGGMSVSDLIMQLAPSYGLDPRAALAVAAQEGLSGNVGDQGTSFGPFQLHYGGAYPSWAPQGAKASQAWASSIPGIQYALQNMSQYAKGLTGNPAIRAIVSRFERPADVPSEVAAAMRAYGSTPSTSGYMVSPGTTATGSVVPRAPGTTFIPYVVPSAKPQPSPINVTGAINQIMRTKAAAPLLPSAKLKTPSAVGQPVQITQDLTPAGDLSYSNLVNTIKL